jgi:hypothetical protein
MKNCDMPAMPTGLVDEDIINDEGVYCGQVEAKYTGLTKREYFAAMAIVPVEIIKEALKEGYPEGFTVEQYIETAVQYKKKEADLLLAALEES